MRSFAPHLARLKNATMAYFNGLLPRAGAAKRAVSHAYAPVSGSSETRRYSAGFSPGRRRNKSAPAGGKRRVRRQAAAQQQVAGQQLAAGEQEQMEPGGGPVWRNKSTPDAKRLPRVCSSTANPARRARCARCWKNGLSVAPAETGQRAAGCGPCAVRPIQRMNSHRRTGLALELRGCCRSDPGGRG